jgi:AcrR family transcriptional regulator
VTTDALSWSASGVVSSGQNLVWRPDLEPRALPATPTYTSSQRAILAVCVELFADQGYAGTSVRDIAGLVGIKPASLYKSFPSKQAMLDALSEIGHAEFGRLQLAAVLGAGESPSAQLAAGMRALVDNTCQYPRLTRVVNHEVRNLSRLAFERDQAARRRSADILHDVVRRGAASGEFLVPDISTLTIVSWGIALALSSWFPYAHDVDAGPLADSYAETALRVVGARGALPDQDTNT